MGLILNNRGTGSNAVSSASVAIRSITNFNTNSLAVLCLTYDNSSTSPAGGDPYTGISDNIGGTWTVRDSRLNDPGAANAGSTLRVFTSDLRTYTTNSIITVTFSVNTTQKTWTLTEVSSSGNTNIARFSSASGSTQSTSTPSVTSTSVTSGSVILGVVGREANGTRTGDGDTTNGSWSTAQSIGSGTTTGGQEIISQYKVVTATATQTYNPTFGGASADGNISWIILNESPATSTQIMIIMDGDGY